MADADVGAIVAAAGVAHGTFFFHFPDQGTRPAGTGAARRGADRQAARPLRRVEARSSTRSSNEAVRLGGGLGTSPRCRVVQRLSCTALFANTPGGRELGSPRHRQGRPGDRAGPDSGRGGRRREPDEQCGVLPAGPVRPADHHPRLADQRTMLDDYVARTYAASRPADWLTIVSHLGICRRSTGGGARGVPR